MDYIILGDRKGTENEAHYKLTLKGLSRGEIVEFKFDVYTEKPEDVMKLIKKNTSSRHTEAFRFVFLDSERRKVSKYVWRNR